MRKTFAERHGYRSVRAALQHESIDDALRNALWDAVNATVFYGVDERAFYFKDKTDEFVVLFERLWNGFFKDPIDTIPNTWGAAHDALRNTFMGFEWYDVYSLIEYIAQNVDDEKAADLKKESNDYMAREGAAYRFVGDEIAPITDDNEIQAIEQAMADAPRAVAVHLDAALGFLSDRDNPDYRNSVKESISAVESAAKILTGDPKATLGQGLKKLPQPLHPAFQGAVSQLYGYTSDKGGIRHALLDEPNVDAAEARFMLVACSAFINFLKERSGNAL
jgi:hypothetical protein